MNKHPAGTTAVRGRIGAGQAMKPKAFANSEAEIGNQDNERTSMKLGFICPDLPGHVNPMTALARQLQALNHEAVFLYSSGAGGLPFVPAPEKDHVNENRSQVSKMHGQDALQFSVRSVLAQTEIILKSLPAIIEANG